MSVERALEGAIARAEAQVRRAEAQARRAEAQARRVAFVNATAGPGWVRLRRLPWCLRPAYEPAGPAFRVTGANRVMAWTFLVAWDDEVYVPGAEPLVQLRPAAGRHRGLYGLRDRVLLPTPAWLWRDQVWYQTPLYYSGPGEWLRDVGLWAWDRLRRSKIPGAA